VFGQFVAVIVAAMLLAAGTGWRARRARRISRGAALPFCPPGWMKV